MTMRSSSRSTSRSPSRSSLALALLLAGGTAPQRLSAQETTPAPDFRTEVLPILEARCFECHQAPRADARGRLRKPKGGLRLDGRDWLLHGGDGGAVLLPGDPDGSPLLARTLLDADDPDLMPERGERLSDAQTAILARWIAAGAPFGDWTGAARDAEPPAASSAPFDAARPASPRALRLAALAGELSPIAPDAMKRLVDAGAHADDLLGDRRLFAVGFPGHQDQIDDRALRSLEGAREHLAELDLARTAVGDAALPGLARLPRLVRLDLSATRVSGAGLRALATAPALRVLVLVGTRLDGAAIDALAALPQLETVYLWRSGLEEAQLATLRAAAPRLTVVGAPALPEPESEAPRANPRRRR
ncbi:MAG: hypothetical protein IT457_24640 [Planctomycetes bacterium]|nr:hypothetical protein [Planctomycetota bacterium]